MEKNTEVSVTETPSSPQTKNNNEGFFSWIKDEESKTKSIKHATSIPWTGLIALAAAFVTTMLSFVLLICVRGKATWPRSGIGKVTQPASWLSALISANSIALHIALTEGVTIAWWFRATRPSATIGSLHQLWATGTSAKSAALDLKRLSYVSLATLFVAIIPINGILLQGALSTTIAEHSFKEPTWVPMVRELPLGFSATMTSAGVLTPFVGTRWPYVFQQVTNAVGNIYSQYAYFGNWDNFGSSNETLNEFLYENKTDSTWKATVPGAGFDISCTSSTVPYNLTINNGNFSRIIYNSSFSWSNSTPNTIHFDLVWKPNYDCVGEYQVRNCTLQAAVVEYPVQIALNVSQAVTGPYYSLQEDTTYHGDKVVQHLDPYPDEGLHNSTYWGIYRSFREWYGGNITLENYYPNTTGSSVRTSNGGFLNSLIVDYGSEEYQGALAAGAGACSIGLGYGLLSMNYSDSFNSKKPEHDSEAGWWYGDFSQIDLADLILGQVRQSAFLAAVYSGSNIYAANYVPSSWYIYDNDSYVVDWYLPYYADHANASDYYVQSANSTRTVIAPTYEVRFYMWGASVGLTYSIILVILPTFYGFWTLLRKPTMSPVDMARAFNAPVVTAEDAHQKMKVDVLLKQVGTTPIHQLPKVPSGLSEARTVHQNQDDSRS